MGLIKKAVIPAAGLGTRFLPATKGVAKELFPIVDKPAILYQVEEAISAGAEEIIFIISPKNKKDAFKRHPSHNYFFTIFLFVFGCSSTDSDFAFTGTSLTIFASPICSAF